MNAKERREKILARLASADEAISASRLAADFSVSRQIIVGDVALLRAAGHEILATPHGYICERARSGVVCQVACRHDAAQMQEELNAIVDQGCTVLDVIVSHPIYGQLTGQLNLSSRYEVAAFIEKATSASAQRSACSQTAFICTRCSARMKRLRSVCAGRWQRWGY